MRRTGEMWRAWRGHFAPVLATVFVVADAGAQALRWASLVAAIAAATLLAGWPAERMLPWLCRGETTIAKAYRLPAWPQAGGEER